MVLDGTELACHLLPEEDRFSCRYRSVGVIGARSSGKSNLIDLFCAVCPFCGHEQGRDDILGAGKQPLARVRNPPAPKDTAESDAQGAGDEKGRNASQGWAINRHTSPKSLKWFCRQAILKHNIPYDALSLPTDLVDYINSIRRSVCMKCESIAIKYHTSTSRIQRFHKLVRDRHKNPLGILMVDWPEWPSFHPLSLDPEGDALKRIEALLVRSLETWVIVYDLLQPSQAMLDKALETAMKIFTLNEGQGPPPSFVLLGTKIDLVKSQATLQERILQHKEKIATSEVAQKGARVVFIPCSLKADDFNAAYVFDQAVFEEKADSLLKTCAMM